MENTIDLVRGIVTLDKATYEAFLASPNVMKRGFLVLLVSFFVAAVPVLGQTWLDNSRRFTAETAAEVEQQFLSMFELIQSAEDRDEANMEAFRNNFAQGLNIAVELDALSTPLPRPLAALLQALGSWFTAAMAGIGPWLGYGALVILFAKLAGGRGVLSEFYGLTALYAVPAVLRIFSFIPFLGFAFSLVALLWGVIVYARAVEVSQGLTAGKAYLVTFLPVIVLAVLFACLGGIGLGSLVAAINSGQ